MSVNDEENSEGVEYSENCVKSSLVGDESDLDVLQQWQEQALLPLQEDLVDWLKKCFDVDITVDSFLSVLDNGCVLCRVAQHIEKKRLVHAKREEPQTSSRLRFKENATSGSWFARDNIANFVSWCRSVGIREDCMFETEGLVSHRSHKEVILCLLELGRLGARYGLEPPGIVQLEQDIDSKSRRRPASVSEVEKSSRVRSKISKAASTDSLDKKVLNFTGRCTCAEKLKVQCFSDGKYNIAGKNVLVRLLKGRHLMVRVGGGWDTLEHYVATHDPCRIVQFKRQGLEARPVSHKANKADFMFVKGNYKAKKKS